jgi:hypothetical protein
MVQKAPNPDMGCPRFPGGPNALHTWIVAMNVLNKHSILFFRHM